MTEETKLNLKLSDLIEENLKDINKDCIVDIMHCMTAAFTLSESKNSAILIGSICNGINNYIKNSNMFTKNEHGIVTRSSITYAKTIENVVKTIEKEFSEDINNEEQIINKLEVN